MNTIKPSSLNRHNALQRVTCLGGLLLISPLPWISGGLSLLYADWTAWGLSGPQLEWVATGHTIGAILMLAFFVSHLYRVTTGHTLTAHTKAMIAGREDDAECNDALAPG